MLVREGASHSIWTHPQTGSKEQFLGILKSKSFWLDPSAVTASFPFRRATDVCGPRAGRMERLL